MLTVIAFAKLDIQYNLEAITSEVLDLPDIWSAHFNHLHYNGRWEIISLRAPGGQSALIVPDITNSLLKYEDTALMEACPHIRSLVNKLECDVMSVRLMNLHSGSAIKEHTDAELSFEQGEARLHLPVVTNEHVEFYVQDRLIKMNAGSAWYINANLPHKVINKGSSDRIHLVIDCKVNERIRQKFGSAEKVLSDPSKNIHQFRYMIAELRRQENVTAEKLADKFEKEVNDFLISNNKKQ
jgi:hypothetical protein